MNTFVIEEFYVAENNACNFYTVRYDDNDTSETDRFYDKFEQHIEYREDFGIIHALIGELAGRGMKTIRRVREESKAFALPPKDIERDIEIDVFENKLRLYYVHVSEDVVILLGGGIAHDVTTGRPSIALWDAQNFVKKIQNAQDAFIVENKKLKSTSGDDHIMIY